MYYVLHPGEVGVAFGRYAVFPTLVVGQAFAAPVGNVERGVGQDEVGFQVGVTVIVESVAYFDLAVDAPDGQVHFGHAPSRIVGLLAEDGNVTRQTAVPVAGGVRADELHGLHEHPS